jgi:putative hydrolase of the HAD superfamily
MQKEIRFVFFDAVGTLLHPEPGAVAVYAETGRCFGSRLGVEAVSHAFSAACARQDQHDCVQGWRTSEERELQRWQQIVGDVLHDVAAGQACFQALYDHFGQPKSWRCAPEIGAVCAKLRQLGLGVGLASNFDRRLLRVIRGFPDLEALQPVVISAEVGWRKPSIAFFEAMARSVGALPEELLYVGDDFDNDYVGAREAGCRALLLANRGTVPQSVSSITRLTEIPESAAHLGT